MRVLLVEDDAKIARPVVRALEREGYAVAHAEGGQTALELSRTWHPEVVLLDLLLPDIDGREVVGHVRRESDAAIIMATCLGAERDRIDGLELGADDYLVKPYSIDELLARIRAVTRRVGRGSTSSQPITVGRLSLDPETEDALVDERPVGLTRKEFELLRMLALHAGAVVRRNDLVRSVWGIPLATAAGTLDVHMCSLRKKLDDDPREPRFIETVRGIGFRLMT